MSNGILKGLAVVAGTGLAMGFTSGRSRTRPAQNGWAPAPEKRERATFPPDPSMPNPYAPHPPVNPYPTNQYAPYPPVPAAPAAPVYGAGPGPVASVPLPPVAPAAAVAAVSPVVEEPAESGLTRRSRLLGRVYNYGNPVV